jgi:hypothetical protein
MTILRLIFIILIVCLTDLAHAAKYWVSTAGSDGNSCASTVGDTDPGTYKLTVKNAVACATSPGDIVHFKSGTYSGADAHFKTIASGTAANPIIIEGDDADTTYCAFSGCGAVWAPTTTNTQFSASHIIIRKISINQVGFPVGYALRIDDGTNILIEDVELYGNQRSANSASCSITGALTTFITFRRTHLHDCGEVGTTLDHGIYQQGDDFVLEDSWIHDNVGFGIQCYTNTSLSDNRADRCKIRRNVIEDNVFGGIAIESNDGEIYDNIIRNNGSNAINIGYSGSLRTKVYNNYLYRSGADAGTAVFVGNNANPASDSEVINNFILGFTSAVTVHASSSGVTQSYNACESAKSCGSTGKVSITAVTDCFVSTTDVQLKQGTNVCRNVGTSVATRPSPIGTTDIGPMEQGSVASAAVAGTLIDVTLNTMGQLLPTSGITGLSVVCGTCTGTPAVDTATLKVGTTTIAQLSLSGLTASGTCTISMGATNLTDGIYIGPPSLGFIQKMNSSSGTSVTGTCANSTGGGGTPLSYPGTPLIYYTFDDNVLDQTAGGDDGTANGITYVSGVYDKAGNFDANENDYVEIPYLNAVDPSSQSLTIAFAVIIDEADMGQTKDLFGTSISGNNRLFLFRGTSNTLRAGVGATFGATSDLTLRSGTNHVCATFNASTDTATLYLNGVAGTVEGASVFSSYGSFTLSSNGRIGLPSGFATSLAGNHRIEEFLLYQSVEDCAAIYAVFNPTATPDSTFSQPATRFHRVFTDISGNSINLGTDINQAQEVIEGGAVAVAIEVDCDNCAATSFKLQARKNGTGEWQQAPELENALGLYMWGASAPNGLNNGALSARLTGSCTMVNGVTLTTSTQIPVVTFPASGCTVQRYIVRLASTGLVPGTDYFELRLVDQNGVEFTGSYTLARINVIGPQFTGGY